MTSQQIKHYSAQIMLLCDEVERLDLSRLSEKELKELDRIVSGLDNVQFNLDREYETLNQN